MPCTKCKDGKYKWGESGECKYESKEACESANKQNHKEMKYVSPLGKNTHTEYVEECANLKLANQKTNLSLAGDLTDLGKELQDSLRKGDEEYDSAFKAEGEARKIIQDLQGYSDELQAAAGRLQTQIDLGFQLLQDAEDSAKEIGVAAKDIPGFISVYDIIYEAEDAVTNYDQLANDIEDINS